MSSTRRVPQNSIIVLLIVHFLYGIILAPHRAFFPIYLKEQLHYPTAVISIFVALGQGLGLLMAFVGGSICDTVGHKRTLILGLLGLTTSSLLYWIRVPWLVVGLWTFSSMGLVLVSLGGQSYLIDVAVPQRLGVLSALYTWGFTVGGALGSPGAGFVLDHNGFGALGTSLFFASLIAVSGALMLAAQHPGRRAEKMLFAAQLMAYRHIICRPGVFLLGMLRFLPTCYWGMAGVLLPLLIRDAAGRNTAVAWYLTGSSVLASLAQMSVGQVADRWGVRAPTLGAFAVLVLGIVGLALFAQYLWALYIFGILSACAAWSLSTLMPTLVSQVAGPGERGRVLGFLQLLWNAGMILGALIGGALVEIVVGLPFLIAAALNIIALGLVHKFLLRIVHE